MSSGHIFAMIASLRNNKRSRTTRFDKDPEKAEKLYGNLKDHKNSTPEALELLRAKMRQEATKKQRQFAVIFGIIMLLIIAGLSYFLFIDSSVTELLPM